MARLKEACADGRLALEEFSERVAHVYRAKSRGDLDVLIRDLSTSGPLREDSTRLGERVDETGRRNWYVTLIGGMVRRGRWRLERSAVFIAVLGGISLDLRQAQLGAPEVTVTAISIIGGATLIVPPGVRVEVDHFSFLGGRNIDTDETTGADTPILRLRAFAIIGGVDVRRAGPTVGGR